MNRNIYVNVIRHIPVTPELLKLTRKKQANTMLNVFMNVMCRFH